MNTNQHLKVRLLPVLLPLVLLGGCGSTARSPGNQQSQAKSSEGRTLNPCTLLTKEEIVGVLAARVKAVNFAKPATTKLRVHS